jgi:cyclic pyranopterin phosphate synthase
MKRKRELSHVDQSGNPQMVDVSAKKITRRVAHARGVVNVGKEILDLIQNNEIITRKGPVFQTAIIAGVMGAKKTSELIPFCHPLGLEDCQVKISIEKNKIHVNSSATVTGKTGVEMEALTAASVAALTIYDMCKALSHNIIIEEIKLMEKTGGKKDFKRNQNI